VKITEERAEAVSKLLDRGVVTVSEARRFLHLPDIKISNSTTGSPSEPLPSFPNLARLQSEHDSLCSAGVWLPGLPSGLLSLTSLTATETSDLEQRLAKLTPADRSLVATFLTSMEGHTNG